MSPSTSSKTQDITFTADLEDGRRTPHNERSSNSQTPTPESRRSAELEHHSHSYFATFWRKVADKLPSPVTRYTRKAWGWIKGPEPPKRYYIKPIFGPAQTFAIRVLARIPRAGRFALLLAGFVVWVVVFGVILSDFSLPSSIGGFGAPVRLACTSRLWYVIYLRNVDRY
jgi:hypothetical protein